MLQAEFDKRTVNQENRDYGSLLDHAPVQLLKETANSESSSTFSASTNFTPNVSKNSSSSSSSSYSQTQIWLNITSTNKSKTSNFKLKTSRSVSTEDLDKSLSQSEEEQEEEGGEEEGEAASAKLTLNSESTMLLGTKVPNESVAVPPTMGPLALAPLPDSQRRRVVSDRVQLLGDYSTPNSRPNSGRHSDSNIIMIPGPGPHHQIETSGVQCQYLPALSPSLLVAFLSVCIFTCNSAILRELGTTLDVSHLLSLFFCHIGGILLFPLLPEAREWFHFFTRTVNKSKLRLSSERVLSSESDQVAVQIGDPGMTLSQEGSSDRYTSSTTSTSSLSPSKSLLSLPRFWQHATVLSLLIMGYNWCFVASMDHTTQSTVTGIYQLNIVVCYLFEVVWFGWMASSSSSESWGCTNILKGSSLVVTAGSEPTSSESSGLTRLSSSAVNRSNTSMNNNNNPVTLTTKDSAATVSTMATSKTVTTDTVPGPGPITLGKSSRLSESQFTDSSSLTSGPQTQIISISSDHISTKVESEGEVPTNRLSDRTVVVDRPGLDSETFTNTNRTSDSEFIESKEYGNFDNSNSLNESADEQQSTTTIIRLITPSKLMGSLLCFAGALVIASAKDDAGFEIQMGGPPGTTSNRLSNADQDSEQAVDSISIGPAAAVTTTTSSLSQNANHVLWTTDGTLLAFGSALGYASYQCYLTAFMGGYRNPDPYRFALTLGFGISLLHLILILPLVLLLGLIGFEPLKFPQTPFAWGLQAISGILAFSVNICWFYVLGSGNSGTSSSNRKSTDSIRPSLLSMVMALAIPLSVLIDVVVSKQLPSLWAAVGQGLVVVSFLVYYGACGI